MSLGVSPFDGYGQEIRLVDPHPTTVDELAEPQAPLISEERQDCYFVRYTYGVHDSYGGHLSRDHWTLDPSLITFYDTTTLFHINLRQQSAIIGTDSVSRVTYYTNRRPRDNTFGGLYAVQPHKGRPVKISLSPLNATDIHSFYLSNTWDVMVFSLSHRDGQGQEDLYVSVQENGKWQTPIHLGASVNTSGSEISPFLSEDRRRLFFASNGHGGFGRYDLMVSERLYDSWRVWSQPVNLGERINSVGNEAYLSIVEDTVAYFLSEATGYGRFWKARVDSSSSRGAFDLTSERDYLEQEEVNSWMKTTLDTTIDFASEDPSLTAEARELLWFVANRMMDTTKISIHFVFFSDPKLNNSRESTRRAQVVRDYLTLLGISSGRILTQVVPRSRSRVPKSTESDAIFSFFREI